jgi:hypothetical protein
MGQNSDADSTAMTLQALAPYYSTDDAVRAAVDRALAWLSQKQLTDGDYSNFGVANLESAVQVLIALSVLEIDPCDSRFVKDGVTLLDGIAKYRLPSGAFSHTVGGEANQNATSQCFLAMVSCLRACDGKGSVYALDHADPAHVTPAPSTDPETDESTDRPEQGGEAEQDGRAGDYKLPAALIILALGGIACLLLVILKKRHVKNFVAILLVCTIAITVVYTTDFRSADDYYNGEDVTKENAIGSVTLTIRCDSVAGRAPHIPESGVILERTEMPIAAGDSVYTVLVDAARKYKLQIENNGGSTYAYIAGINYLYELDFGDLSGWTYLVNGERPSVGAGEYRLADGDVIEWYYTLNLGEDTP